MIIKAGAAAIMTSVQIRVNDCESIVFSFGCAGELGVGAGKIKRPD